MYTTKCFLHKCTQGIQCDVYFNVGICIHFVSYISIRVNSLSDNFYLSSLVDFSALWTNITAGVTTIYNNT